MRLLLAVVLILLALGLLGFLATNLYTTVTVWLGRTEYRDVNVGLLVIISVTIGAVVTGVFALAEGARTRLENRRLRREIHKLETEINYLRTQPPAAAAASSSALTESAPRAGPGTAPTDGAPPPSAPVYGRPVDEQPTDDDDDAYSGGRAV